MTIKLPRSTSIQGPNSSPKARLPKAAKPRQSQGFSPLSLVQCWPGHWPGRLGPTVAKQGPSQGLSSPALGPPMDIRAVAGLIGCSPWSVRQTLIPRGLPHFRFKASGRLIFYRDQVIRWIEEQQQGGQQ